MLSSDTLPIFAVDGKYETIFHSKEEGGGENYPWIQANLRKTMLVETITIVNRIAGPDSFDYGNLLQNVEVRAGPQSLGGDFKGPIIINIWCGQLLGPGEAGRIYTIKCKKKIVSKYITVQLMTSEQTTLHISEILVNEFKSVGRYILIKFKVSNNYINQYSLTFLI